MNKQKLKQLTDWDWTTLVAAWRYYEHRSTIALAMFPHEIVQRFFTGEYDEKSCDNIARQFVDVDHFRGPDDKLSGWLETDAIDEIDRRAWRLFYWFLKAWHEAGFRELHIRVGNKEGRVECFMADGKWYAKEGYIKFGDSVSPYKDEEIVEDS